MFLKKSRRYCDCLYNIMYNNYNIILIVSPGFHTGFFVGGGGEVFRNSEIDIKHTFLGGSGDMPP